MNIEDANQVNIAISLFDEGEFEAAREILKPLIKDGVGYAVRINSSFFEAGMAADEMDAIYVEGMFKAAELGDVEALYFIGSFYDLGHYLPQNKEKASRFFKQAAEAGHPHCQWIYACELLWGKGSFSPNVDEGLRYLELAIESGSADACVTQALFYNEESFGFPKDSMKVKELCALAVDLDETVHIPANLCWL